MSVIRAGDKEKESDQNQRVCSIPVRCLKKGRLEEGGWATGEW